MLVLRKNQQPTISDFVNQFFNNDYINRMEESFNVISPKSNIQEFEKNYQIDMIVPGFNKKDFAIEVEDDNLRVSAKVENKKEEKNDQFIHEEFEMKSIERSFKLSHVIDSSKISATYSNGILSINVPKKADAVIKKMIEIK